MNEYRLLKSRWTMGSLLILGLLLSGYTEAQARYVSPGTPKNSAKKNLSGKRVLFVVFDRFDQSEYGIPRKILRSRGASVTVASSSLRTLRGYQKSKNIKADLLLKNSHMSGYDGLVFVGWYRYETNNAHTHRLTREALAQGKPVAAICIGPVTLAKAGVIKGRRVTGSTRHAVLRRAGGRIINQRVVRDGLLITGNGPAAAGEFGETIAAALAE